MGLMDEFKQERFGPPIKCGVHKLVELLGGQDGAELLKAVDDTLIPATVIEKVLARKHQTLKAVAINRHRRGECSCGN